MLDFSREKVHSIGPFLRALGLGRKHMSKQVKERRTVRDGKFHGRLRNQFRRKAYAISRYAAHLGSVTAVAKHALLLATDVLVSDGIGKTMAINLGDQRVEVESKKAYIHLEEQGDKLKLYVPRDKSQREAALLRELPRTLLECLGAKKMQGAEGLGTVIGASSLATVDMLLE
ncbi:hypothetical protein K402DRAFT_404890 [Aulographum hederae CBS 113979]|uniref:Uncharacterized protein n=1 Tax=Aulographum hederae CBS 113979 TaxID=1176131 RepID=A0A6G1GYD2_9PEZI|nr:hypothetical protein K402DRAFT_404890 [Aulographum hederae CBS 113979]